jgi:transposase-like protein
MRKPRKLDVACPNKECRAYNRVGLLNIIRHGKRPNGTQNYRCTECGRQFVRTYGTPFYRKHLSKQEIIRISKQFVEKSSFRGVSRATGHHLDTIRNLAGDVAEHCYAVTAFLITDVKLGTHEIDEFWSFVKKNKRGLNAKTLRTMNKVMRTPISTLREKLISL